MSAKIEFEDNFNDTKLISRKKKSRNYFVLATFLIIISLIVGAVGGVGGIVLLSSDNGKLAKQLGIKDFDSLSIPTTRTEKIVIEESNAIIDASKKVSPAVVSIVSKAVYQDIFGRTYESGGAGTGFILTNDGLIITNKHVVAEESTQYTVVLSDGKSYDAEVKSRDPYNDIAVLKINAENLPVVELGDSDQLVVGQWIVAVGNALGRYQNTVTAGVVSAKNRSVEASDSTGQNTEKLDGLIQTDAAINSGNSGGPIVNLKGQVVGINTAVAANAQNIGFAIPINLAKSAIDSIKETGKIIRPYLGVRYVPITKDIAEQNKLAVDYGAMVVRGNSLGDVAVVPGSPADKAGIVENDIILEINGEKINADNSLVQLIQQYKVGQEVELKVLSKGSEKSVKLKLEEMK